MRRSLLALRARYLLAMGIPGAAVLAVASCGPARGSAEGRLPEPPDPTPASTPVDEQGHCGPDWVRSSSCGFAAGSAASGASPAEDCPKDSSGLRDKYLSRGGYYDSRPASLDVALTSEWRALGPPLRKAEPYCCYSKCAPLEVHAAPNITPGRNTVAMPECISMPDAPSSQPSTEEPRCPAAVRVSVLGPGQAAEFARVQRSGDAPDKRPALWRVDECCYTYFGSPQGVGRALRVDGRQTVAAAREGAGWLQRGATTVEAVPAELRPRLVRHWSRVAELEHASVAAFARLSLQLMALGAPAELLRATHEAAIDEVEHARIAFGLASAYADVDLCAAALDAHGPVTSSLEELALETLLDGCLEETVGAVWATRAADRAADPTVAAALARIAEDEARHAELAWRILAWALSVDGALGPKLLAAFESGRAGGADPIDEQPCLEQHGVLGARATAELRAEVERAVVAPCLGALLASRSV